MCQCVHENQMVMAECVEQLEFTPRWDGGCDSCSPKLLVGGGRPALPLCVLPHAGSELHVGQKEAGLGEACMPPVEQVGGRLGF